MGTPKAVPVFRTGFNYDGDVVSSETGVNTGSESPTQQQFREEVDINNIVAKFVRTGELPDAVVPPVYGDFTELPGDYQTALMLVTEAQEAFMRLDPRVRAKFGNDAGAFMDFVSNPANAGEFEGLGISKPKPPAGPPEAESASVVKTASSS